MNEDWRQLADEVLGPTDDAGIEVLECRFLERWSARLPEADRALFKAEFALLLDAVYEERERL